MAKKDATQAIRLKAGGYPDAEEGTSCTQTSYKTGKKAFLYIGQQGGRHKAMFRLEKSLPEATKLAKKEPGNYGAGSMGWVTVRFTDDEPMPKKLWEKWLGESYKLAAGSGTKPAKKKATKKRR